MSEHLAVSTLVSGDHSMQHLICVKGAIQVQARWTADKCQSNPSHPLVIQIMPFHVIRNPNDDKASVAAVLYVALDRAFV
jgi:hypothetical protein